MEEARSTSASSSSSPCVSSSAVDKGKLSLIKKKREKMSTNRSNTNDMILENSDDMKGEEQSGHSGDNSKFVIDEKKKAIEEMKESCNSIHNTGMRGGISKPTTTAIAKMPSTGRREIQSKSEMRAAPTSQTSKLVIQWTCDECHHSCIPVRSESRCLCGHRYKEHKFNNSSEKCQCSVKNCPCQHFYFIVAEGAWILRCRCKHKHIDHNPGNAPFLCKKTGCGCTGFDSPWVCNCGHAWANHTQSTIRQQQQSLMMPSSEGNNQDEIQEVISSAMASDSMNDIKSDMMFRRDGRS